MRSADGLCDAVADRAVSGQRRRGSWLGNAIAAAIASPFLRYDISVGKWCTVTVTDGGGKRYSLDVNADSSYDAAHLYLTHVRGNPGCGLPIPTTSTLFEVVTQGSIHRVPGARLKKWIENRRQESRGPRVLYTTGVAIQSYVAIYNGLEEVFMNYVASLFIRNAVRPEAHRER
jgi:hypothetical protein